jgi:D-glycerate 3-kinase
MAIWSIVTAWIEGKPPSLSQRQQLIEWELSVSKWLWPAASTVSNQADWHASVGDALRRRMDLLRSLRHPPQVAASFPLPGDLMDWLVPLWQFWLPLAQRLDAQQRILQAPFIQGILGGQGTGKTTLTQILQLILAQLGHQTVCLSIDDLYLTYAKRCELRAAEPLLKWRGPPGTHDLDLAMTTLSRFKQPGAAQWVEVPQFDKSLHQGQGDRTNALRQPLPSIVLLEGWLVGMRPISDDVFADDNPLPDPILTAADRQLARDSNRRLQAYLPLWDFLDSLMVLYPENYRQSQQWRQQAEKKMADSGRPGLTPLEIAEFVTYFWKALHPALFIAPLTQSPETDLVVNIRADHSWGEVYSPSRLAV